MQVSSGKKILYIVEWMINEKLVPLKHVLMHLIRIYRNEHIDAITYYSDRAPSKSKYLFKNGFIMMNKVPIIIANTKAANSLNIKNLMFEFHIGNSDAV